MYRLFNVQTFHFYEFIYDLFKLVLSLLENNRFFLLTKHHVIVMSNICMSYNSFVEIYICLDLFQLAFHLYKRFSSWKTICFLSTKHHVIVMSNICMLYISFVYFFYVQTRSNLLFICMNAFSSWKTIVFFCQQNTT